MKTMRQRFGVAIVALGLACSVAATELASNNNKSVRGGKSKAENVKPFSTNDTDEASKVRERKLEEDESNEENLQEHDGSSEDNFDGQIFPIDPAHEDSSEGTMEERPVVGSETTISNYYKYETPRWVGRNLEGYSELDLGAFDRALKSVSEDLCDLGITATVFDQNSEEIYQKSVGAVYTTPSGYLQHQNIATDWSGDAPMSLYSNSKAVAASTFLAAVVDTGLGYLDEPLFVSFPEFLSVDDVAGRATPRMILSHTSGLATYSRGNPEDPYYNCLYDDDTVLLYCLGEYILTDATLLHEPGSKAMYSNEPFDILAALAVKKTGLNNFGEVFQTYIAKPLDMDYTTYDCPVVQSTAEKPHVAWGLCSTAHDMAKWVQMLSNDGIAPDGTQVLSKYSANQILTQQQGYATNGDETLIAGLRQFPLTRCYQRLNEEPTLPPSAIFAYGLGAMFFPGNKGTLIGHAATNGGLWIIAKGRFSIYFGWQHDNADSAIHARAYAFVACIVDKLEETSTFLVRNSHRENGSWEQLETCGGDMFIDYWDYLGFEGVKNVGDLVGLPACADGSRRRTTAINLDWSHNLEETASILKNIL